MQTKFIKYCNCALLFATLCMVSAGIFLSSCQKEEEDNKVELYSFGPMPIARGAELKFIGKNLDKVTAVVIPDNLTITTFTTQTSKLLTLIVPQEAARGLVVLNTPQGDITTKTEIGYIETMVILSFTPTTIKPGAELTIAGDYLNLVGEVIFTDRVKVDSTLFTGQSRTELKLLVPAAAQTGKIAVSDAEENPIIVYSADPLTVKLPAFTDISPNPVKAGAQLTITGTDLDLVKTVTLGGNKNVTSFVSQSETEIVLDMPADTKDGVVILVPASGVKVQSADDLIMVVPTVSVTPTTLKNGEDITVSGTDLDLVDKVIFGGNKQGTINTGGTETEIIVTTPDDATTGDVTFVTKADKEVTGPTLMFIDPGFTSFNPTSGKANTTVTITGTDLDLVADVVFTGGKKGTIGTRSETQLSVTVPLGASTGKITLVAKNGTQVESANDYTVLANLPNFSGFTESQGRPGQILTLNGTNMDLIKELVFPGEVYATAYGIKSSTMVQVYVPLTITRGYGQIRMITYEGEEGLLPELWISGTDEITAQTIMYQDYEQHGGHNGWWDESWTDNTATDIKTENGNTYFKVTASLNGWITACNHQANGALGPVISNIENYNLKFDIRIDAGVTGAENAAMQVILGDGWHWYGTGFYPATTGGYWITVTIPATALGLSGTLNLSSGTNGLYGGPMPGGISLDNFRFDPK